MKKLITPILLLSFIMSVPLHADALKTARTEIGKQLKLLKKQDIKNLKLRFTDRQKKRVTAENVKKAQRELKNYTLEDLVESVEEGEYAGKKTIEIKMKNGRTLTTLIEDKGQWYADTIWFR